MLRVVRCPGISMTKIRLANWIPAERAIFALSDLLPMKDVANIVGLTFTDDEFLAIAKRDEPALAGEHTHFADLVDVHQSIAVDSPERTAPQTFFQGLQVLGGEIALFAGDNPDKIATRLKGEYLFRNQQKVLFARLANNLAETRIDSTNRWTRLAAIAQCSRRPRGLRCSRARSSAC